MYGQKEQLKIDIKPFEDYFTNDSNVIFAIAFGSSKDGVKSIDIQYCS